MKTSTRLRNIISAFLSASLLGTTVLISSCGGGGSGGAGGGAVPAPVNAVPAAVTAGLTDQSVVAGTTATFTVVATNATGYQFQRSNDGGLTFTNVSGATSSSYTTPATILADTGAKFRVVVSGSTNSVTSSAAALTVIAAQVAPLVILQPADQSVVEGANASFSVTATGTSLSYQWQRSTDGGVSFTSLAGATNATLTRTAVPLGDNANQFRVVVNNTLGSVTSNVALMTVSAAPATPAFTTQPANQSAITPAAATFSAVVTGSPTPTLQWQRSTDGGVSFVNIAGATASSYTTPATSGTDNASQFRLVASNASSTVNSSMALLSVSVAPAIPAFTTQPANTTIDEGQNASFTVVVTGVPTPTLQWQLSTDSGANWSNINGATAASLNLSAVALSSNGQQFRAVASNGSGSVNSNPATLTVVHVLVVRTLAGTGASGSADGAGNVATFNGPYGVATDSAGNVYVADTSNLAGSSNNTIRKITPAGVVSTLAGTGASGSADGAGNVATFNGPLGVATDSAGNVYVADQNNDKIRKITPAGVVSTLAGTGVRGALDGAGNLATFNCPTDVATDSASNVYVVDFGNLKIRKITPTGVVSTFAGTGNWGGIDGAGNVATFANPVGVATDSADNVYVSDTLNDKIRKITPTGVVSTLAGTGAPGSADGARNVATFNGPVGVATDSAGNVYVGDGGNHKIRKIIP